MSAIADFASLLTVFFTQYLMQQRQVSPHTIASYRDTFRLLVAYVHKSLGKPPQQLSVADMGIIRFPRLDLKSRVRTKFSTLLGRPIRIVPRTTYPYRN